MTFFPFGEMCWIACGSSLTLAQPSVGSLIRRITPLTFSIIGRLVEPRHDLGERFGRVSKEG